MAGFLVFAYGLLAYVVFFLSFLYAIGFVGNLVVPKTIDSGVAGSTGEALAVNLLLLIIFALQHNVMARPAFKRWWTRIVPDSAERSTFVLLSSLCLILLYWKWQPMPGIVWQVQSEAGQLILHAIFWLGWLVVLVSTFLINHFDLFGLRQAYLRLVGKPYTHLKFTKTTLYGYVRHPILLGFIIAFWATPAMTQGHLLFAVVTTVWMVVSIQLEERDLRAFHGKVYKQYQNEVPMLVPWRKPGKRG